MAVQGTHAVEILDPTLRTLAALPAAPRLQSLAGKTIGLLDNSKEKADIFLAALAERLREHCQGASVITHRKPTYSRVAPPALLADLQEQCACVITAMGA